MSPFYYSLLLDAGYAGSSQFCSPLFLFFFSILPPLFRPFSCSVILLCLFLGGLGFFFDIRVETPVSGSGEGPFSFLPSVSAAHPRDVGLVPFPRLEGLLRRFSDFLSDPCSSLFFPASDSGIHI